MNRTALHAAHGLAGGKLAPFGGYDMPVQYPLGVLGEHRWTREHAGLFDVSHMGPSFLRLKGPTGDAHADHRAVAALVEPLVCGDIAGLKPGQNRYTLLLNPDGGIADDLMIGRPIEPEGQGSLYIVVNAGTKDADFARIAAAAGEHATLERADEGGLLALQGPEAAAVAVGLFPGVQDLGFMALKTFDYEGATAVVSRSGYTGEDGFEILVPQAAALKLWDALLADDRVRPIGLGARDSLRLEAGLPLYGHDLDDTVSPLEADLGFAVSKKRRERGDIPGAARIEAEAVGGLSRVRVGLRVLTGAPAREGSQIADGGRVIGRVTSGGFGPTLAAPIALGFVPPQYRAPGTALQVVVRGRALPAEVVATPFVPHRYVRKPIPAKS
ncbi:glycine cleavage system aminomethyltransferase GcvT [Caulobacter sp. S45]|uniref:glycine cleavage system aminomethyltransferase GcvT n=1 Tax=Caulobacter sp. S45 TaxID=1641861 RepID=UPI0020C675D3|nr:glycine cleavage system aminomethyltransferase GcvT [Caulobacter sp. S45]